MRGIDVSHWQGSIDWSKVTAKFAFIKATEGTSFTDSRLEKNKEGARKNGILCGFYHFAGLQDAKKEAEYFVSKVGELQEGELLILDWEKKQVSYADSWCRTFLDRVYELTGVRPLFYTYTAILKERSWSLVRAGSYGLWIAYYGYNNGVQPSAQPYIGQWPFYVVWQYTSRGNESGISGYVDLNDCPYEMEVLKKYGKKITQTPSTPDCSECEKKLAETQKDLESAKSDYSKEKSRRKELEQKIENAQNALK